MPLRPHAAYLCVLLASLLLCCRPVLAKRRRNEHSLASMIPEALSTLTRRNIDTNEKLTRTEHVYKVRAPVSTRNPFSGISLPQHPFMGPNDHASTHYDSYASDSVGLEGPVADELRVIRQRNPYGYAPVIVANKNNQIISVSFHIPTLRFWLVVADKDLNIISATKLGLKVGSSFSGAYFYMNHLEQTVVISSNKILCFDTSNVTKDSGTGGTNSLKPLWSTPNIVKKLYPTKPLGNAVYASMPIWGEDPNVYWVLLAGNHNTTDEHPAGIAVVRITPDPTAKGGAHTEILDYQELEDEWSNNTAVADEDGVYFVTNVKDATGKNSRGYLRKMMFKEGKIVPIYNAGYKNSGILKVGHANIGSGTTPTLMDTKEGRKLVAIVDNDNPRINVVIYDRVTGKKLSETPVLPPMRGAAEASLIGVENAIVVENNYGHEFTFPYSQFTQIEPGMTRLNIAQKGSDGIRATHSWTDDRSSFLAVAVLARKSGIIYAHTADWGDSISATEGAMYFVSAIDAFSGRTLWRIPLGRGVEYCHDYGAMAFNYEQSLYIGTANFLVAIQNYGKRNLQNA